MTLMGLDLNSSRARAVCGVPGLPRPVALEGTEAELPLAVSLERRRPEVGRAGLALCRRLPHLACLDFLGHLGTQRTWRAGRHQLDAGQALSLVFQRLQPFCAGVRGLAAALPSYLVRPQAGQLAALAQQARLPLLGSVSAPLAAAWTAHTQQPWRGLALVVDVDEHALTCTAVAADEPGANRQVRLLAEQTLPPLRLRVWKERLLDGIADRCIRQSRRDPRDSAPAEQALYDQLDEACDLGNQGQAVELAIQATHWYQGLTLLPGELETFCRPLVRQTLTALQAVLTTTQAERSPAVVLLSGAAGRLPGLEAAVRDHSGAATVVTVLPADALARAAHELAERWRSGALPGGHIDVSLPLLRPSPEAVTAPLKSTLRVGNTKLPPRGSSKLGQMDDDFSVTIEE